MDAEEFSKLHAGKLIKVVNTSDVPRIDNPNPIGRIVGWVGSIRLIVEFEDAKDQARCWDPTLIYKDNLVLPAKYGWGVNICNIDFIEKDKDINLTIYIKNCKICKATAHKYKAIILCSNFHCKSRKKFKKQYCSYDKKSVEEYRLEKKTLTDQYNEYIDKWWDKSFNGYEM